MGLSLFNNCCVYPSNSNVVAPNPDPARFEIIQTKSFKNALIARIKYPDCTNYDGIKLCVYKGLNREDLRNARRLDPHFSTQHMSPFARFKPDKEGWDAACKLAESL